VAGDVRTIGLLLAPQLQARILAFGPIVAARAQRHSHDALSPPDPEFLWTTHLVRSRLEERVGTVASARQLGAQDR